MCVKFQLASSNTFQDMRGSQIYTGQRCIPQTPLAEKNSFPKSALDPI